MHSLAHRSARRYTDMIWATKRLFGKPRPGVRHVETTSPIKLESETDTKDFRDKIWTKNESFGSSQSGLSFGFGEPEVILFREHMTRLLSLMSRDEIPKGDKIPEEFDIVMRLFWDLARGKKLVAGDIHEVARLLNNATRLKKIRKSCENLPWYVEDFRQLYITGGLPPHPLATMHLISIYSNLQQYQLSIDIADWAIQRDINYADLATVGAILPVLALVDTTNQRYEELYRYAVTNIPHNICSYDLSHGAILPDRSKHVNVGNAMKILNDVLEARFIYGDWRNAYLTLDTIFRDFPFNPPPTALDSVINERPLHESYMVFFMFTRSGAFIKPRSLMLLLGNTCRAQRIGGHLGLNISLARAMFHLFEAYLKSRGEVDERHLNSLLQGILSLLSRSPVTATAESKRFHDLEHKIIETLLNKLYDFFARRGTPKTVSTCAILISMSGRLTSFEIFKSALQAFTNAELLADQQFCESLITAAGELKHPALMRAAWTGLSQKVSNGDYNLRLSSWRLLATAARMTGLVSYVADQVDIFGEHLKDYEFREIQKASRERAPWEDLYKSVPDSATSAMRMQRVKSIRAFCDEMGVLLRNLDNGESHSHSASYKPSIWAWPNDADEHWEREIYDEMSLESPETAAIVEGISGAIWSKKQRINIHRSTLSPTGQSISEVRYLNFKTINKILILCEVWEGKKNKSEHDARTRENLMNRHRGQEFTSRLNRPDHREQIIAHLVDRQEEASKHETKEQWRAKVRNLRSPEDKDYRAPLGSR